MSPRIWCWIDGHREVPNARWVMARGVSWRLELWMFQVCQRCDRRRFVRDTGKWWVVEPFVTVDAWDLR